MKTIAVIAFYQQVSQFYKKHIQGVFGNEINVECHYIENNLEHVDLNADLILVSSHIIYEHLKKINKNNIETIVLKRTFTKKGFQKIKELQYDGDILFVSTFYEMAVESVAQLYELGVQNLKFVPFNPVFQAAEQYADIKIAVTAGETDRVPAHIEQVIDTGERVLDISTIADIGVKLNISSERMNNLIESYKNDLIVTNYGFKRMMDETGELKNQLNTILSFITDSIIAVDVNGFITEYNEVSESIFKRTKQQTVGMQIADFFRTVSLKDVHNRQTLEGERIFLNERQMEDTIDNVMVSVAGSAVVMSKYPLKREEKLIGFIFISKKYMEMENEHNRLRSKLIPEGHVAKYTFDSILGNSEKMKKLRQIAEKMARSSSTILITGESGTGKEVFAQAIHNASLRKEKPFLAINCSALAANLLESELFGYEEGAFTGAKKGGKVGLFELASGGTMFLDEIGELPYEMQAKLLRVLMERDMMRVGGTAVIHVDVRIIAATNKNLRERMERGLFREDLFYRLNVLPLSLPPLRQRKEDILTLAERFFGEFGREKSLTEEARDILRTYSWPGNVRELRNCMEYMHQMSGSQAGEEDIPEYIGMHLQGQREALRSPNELLFGLENSRGGKMNGALRFNRGTDQNGDSLESKDRLEINRKKEPYCESYDERELLVLRILFKMNGENRSAGRKSISAELGRMNLRISEQEIRFHLKRLSEAGLVQVNRGRAGCKITEAGIYLIQAKPKKHQ